MSITREHRQFVHSKQEEVCQEQRFLKVRQACCCLPEVSVTGLYELLYRVCSAKFRLSDKKEEEVVCAVLSKCTVSHITIFVYS
jgi:hypothetical protein